LLITVNNWLKFEIEIVHDLSCRTTLFEAEWNVSTILGYKNETMQKAPVTTTTTTQSIYRTQQPTSVSVAQAQPAAAAAACFQTSSPASSEHTQYTLNYVNITGHAPIIRIGRLLAVLPIIGIGRLVGLYQPIVVYTTGKYKFLLLILKVNVHQTGFRFR